MKLFQEPIDVQVRNGAPAALRWRGCVYRVARVLQEWAWRGRWWTDATLQGETRHYYRVACTPPSRQPTCLDIYERRGGWVLSRVLD